MQKTIRVAVASAFAFALVLGVASLLTEVEARPPCLCPDIYAPVTCDNGKTYPNECVAKCHRAKNCVPAGDIF